MEENRKHDEILKELLAAASPKALVDLLLQLARSRPDVRRECFEFLAEHVSLSEEQQCSSEGEAVLALWAELLPDLDELDEYGGGDYELRDAVSSRLYQIKEKLENELIDAGYRHKLLELVLPYIAGRNIGLDDDLYEIAYAACFDDSQLRSLAEAFEAMGGDYPRDHARNIYRTLGDRDKYLQLRRQEMIYGGDYHDLATFYWEAGEKEQALKVAEEGLSKGEGRMDELRQFLARQAMDSGNRQRYLELQFAQAIDHLNLEKYKTFKEICTSPEWEVFEGKVLEHVPNASRNEQLMIRMHRQEYAEAIGILMKGRYPHDAWASDYEVQAAKQLENCFPEEILKFYLSGLGNLNYSATRKEYTRNAKLMVKIRHMLIDILQDENRWLDLARRVKRDNLRRPAFQEEFTKIVPGWRELT